MGGPTPTIGHNAPAGALAPTHGAVLFHPDYHRRLRSRTESADPDGANPQQSGRPSGARGLRHGAITAGGDFHPALRTEATPGAAGDHDTAIGAVGEAQASRWLSVSPRPHLDVLRPRAHAHRIIPAGPPPAMAQAVVRVLTGIAALLFRSDPFRARRYENTPGSAPREQSWRSPGRPPWAPRRTRNQRGRAGLRGIAGEPGEAVFRTEETSTLATNGEVMARTSAL